ncbi:UspA domain protein [Sulfolobus islandicus L.S.2.15]|uniref:UspA domain protein n=2 Tax=Saccharolobus islandicus TaxID=43080 RepID=C3MNF3_SACI2|nr:universal stress protein [Sulfolobus islandicus]ACP34916.1 UspA domain protein [Sulfolobus islandicus L.S.2.15]ADB86530.1 UspA domain protein [Sulfolobus islandicus L.D.8.5]
MVFKNIVVAYDGSENAKRALDVAIDLAKRYEARLTIIEVIDTSVLVGMGLGPIPSEVINEMYNKAKKDVEEAKEKAINSGVKNVEAVNIEGDPATAIMDYAGKAGADMIVTGSRGLSTVKRIFLGSVSSRIVHEAKIPVLVVK